MKNTPTNAGSNLMARMGQGCQLGALAAAVMLAGCGSSSPPPDPDPDPPAPTRVMPAGRLVQTTLNGPITHTTELGWRTRIDGGSVTILPPEGDADPGLQYVAWRMREQLGTHDLRAWDGERRTVLLPGGARLTMHGEAGEIMRLSLYDGAESHEVNVLSQTLLHSRVDAAEAQTREAAEADGETGYLQTAWRYVGGNLELGRLHLANLYAQPAAANGTPLRREAAVRVLGRQDGPDLHLNVTDAPAAEPDEVCTPTTAPRGRLVRREGGDLEYVTRSGLWTMRVNAHTITLTRGTQFSWQVWGDPHENLNGKHIKDWLGTRRTLLLDDGTKITMHADGSHGVVHTTQIYDGEQSHEIGNIGNLVRHSCVNAQVAATRDAEEADGETAYLANLRGPAHVSGYLYVENVYTEEVGAEGIDEPVFEVEPLGETGDDGNPNQVNDLYDDERLAHT